MDSKRPFAERTLIFIFIAVLFLPALGFLVPSLSTFRPDEKRALTPFPSFRLGQYPEYPKHFEAFFNDHFLFRNELVYAYHFLRLRVFHLSMFPAVLVGKDGWLYYTGDRLESWVITENPLAEPRFSPKELGRTIIALQRLDDTLSAQNALFLFFVAPDKESIYPEYLPARFKNIRLDARMNQLVHPALDLRPALLTAKEQMPAYSKTDTHWNDWGAFAAYRKMLLVMAEKNAAVPVPELRNYAISRKLAPATGDLASMVMIKNALKDERITLRRNTVNASPSPLRVVLVADSFADALVPYFKQDFKNFFYIRMRNATISAVLAKKPDVVIYLRVERDLHTLEKTVSHGF